MNSYDPNKMPVQKCESFCCKLEQFISSEYTRGELKVGDIASALAMCERQLQRNTKMFFNLSPIEYLRKYRLFKSSLLIRLGAQVQSASIEVGFNSYSYFARCFNDEFGCSATQFAIKQKW
jgi:AraC-like DNA-binding protein